MVNLPQLLVATSNSGKLQEIGEILQGLNCKILSLKDQGLSGDFEEKGETFAEVAAAKASYYAQQSGLVTLAEDSGILVNALPGELGIKTRRWGAGEHASDEEWIEYFFERMKDVSVDKRGAAFICSAAVVDKKGAAHVFEGRTEGVITFELEAPLMKGLPLSSCFRPDGFGQVYAALSVAEKNRISHRGKAIAAARAFLENHFSSSL